MRRHAVLVGMLVATLAAVALGWMLGLPVATRHMGLVVPLELIAAGTVLGEIVLKRSVPVQFDALAAIAAIVLILGGPVAGFTTWLLPDLSGRLMGRYRLTSPGFLANIASYAWATLAGWGLLCLGGAAGDLSASAAPTVACVTVAMFAVNWLVARGVFGPLYQGARFVSLLRTEYLTTLATQCSLAAIAGAAAIAIALTGAPAVIALSGIVLVPQIVLPLLATDRDIRRLDTAAAALLYARALSRQLRLSRGERRLLVAAAGAPAPSGDTGISWVPRLGDVDLRGTDQRGVWVALAHAGERWDGTGGPASLSARMIPQASRILAVARQWALLTSADGPCLAQAEAVLALESEAATRFDPDVVRAAGEIVATESQLAAIDSFQPKLAQLPLPAALRLHAGPWALRAFTAA